MRSTPLSLLIVGAAIAFSVWLLAPRQVVDEPQPVAPGETAVQKIRSEDGSVDTWTYQRLEQSGDAQPVETVRVAPQPTGAARILNAQALSAWSTGDIRSSVDLFEEAIAADPNDPLPLSNYGRRLTLMVDYEKAQPLLLRASELNPEDPQVWLDLLTFYEKTLQFQRANDARQRARELAGDRAFVRNETGAWLLEGSTLL